MGAGITYLREYLDTARRGLNSFQGVLFALVLLASLITHEPVASWYCPSFTQLGLLQGLPERREVARGY